ncbi:hypothetical protein SZ60_02635, partial [Frigoribacterium sp. MEB024]
MFSRTDAPGAGWAQSTGPCAFRPPRARARPRAEPDRPRAEPDRPAPAYRAEPDRTTPAPAPNPTAP